jgi:hypothetical protein
VPTINVSIRNKGVKDGNSSASKKCEMAHFIVFYAIKNSWIKE